MIALSRCRADVLLLCFLESMLVGMRCSLKVRRIHFLIRWATGESSDISRSFLDHWLYLFPGWGSYTILSIGLMSLWGQYASSSSNAAIDFKALACGFITCQCVSVCFSSPSGSTQDGA